MSILKKLKPSKKSQKHTKSLSDFVFDTNSRELKKVVKKAVRLANEDQRKLMGKSAN